MNHSEPFDARLGEQAKKNHAVIMVKIHRILANTFCCATRANRANRCNFAMRKARLFGIFYHPPAKRIAARRV
jgi:tRNA U34 5-methylaminomethyl-2-thiouridine-forming methyltransferase MnmC